jgi:hypothetical protein
MHADVPLLDSVWLHQQERLHFVEFSTQSSLCREITKKETNGGKDLYQKAKLPLKIKIFLWYFKKEGHIIYKR